ncbi:MAG TPA: NirA family protein [Stellaceae bacterium]|nr:NirA family protein [Stellaceae bacterium]
MSEASEFTEEQKHYLEAFLGSVLAKRGAPPVAVAAAPAPSDLHRAAQDRVLAAGGKLVPEEQAKRDGNPLDLWDVMRENVALGRFPKGFDVFRHKFHGLFYVAPAQNAFMCRLRMPGGILSAHQFRGIADIAESCAGGYADVTTRANLQLREIAPQRVLDVLMAVQDLGLTSRGSGADNIRNITGSPTAGIDAQELIDTRPLAHALHHYILNQRELYGLPRKFNIAFDGGGQISVLEDTNDIGFAAVRVGAGQAVPAGVYFRLELGGITGHGDFARDTGVVVAPAECVPVAVAVVRAFIEHGDRTDRRRARLKYVLDRMGLEKFLAETEKHLGSSLRRVPQAALRPRGPVRKHAHIGVHAQRQAGLNYVGAVLPVGRLTAAQMRGIAALAETHGSGTLRLTVWQNLLISDIEDAGLPAVVAGIERLGLSCSASNIRGALVACTGNTGCKFSATDTKGQALALAAYLDSRLALDQPVNIHLTGCPHSCAQHYVGDIGLLGVKVDVSGDPVEGYAIYVGGGAGSERALAREIYPGLPMSDVPRRVEGLLRAYLAHRGDATESFHEFVKHRDVVQLRALAETALATVN